MKKKESATPVQADPFKRLPFGRQPREGLRVPKTAEVVADHIRRQIISGELQEGDSLPPEGQLMTTLSISRPTLREAFRILEAERLISVVRGSRTGARVHQPSIENASRYAGFVLQASGTTIGDIYQARLAIEPYAARQLAEQQPAGATDRLREEVEHLAGLMEAEQYVDFMIGLAEFHRVLVELGGNQTLHFLICMLQDVVAQYQVRHLKLNPLPLEQQRKQAAKGIRSFHKLIDLIDKGEAEEAEAHWRLHLINSNKSWGSPEQLRAVLDVVN